MMTELPQVNEVVRWQSYPSWGQFVWLYFFSLMAGFRGALFLWFGMPGGEMWLAGAVILLVCVAFLRRWARYLITSHRVVVKNGYTSREIQSVALEGIGEVTIKQGPVAQFMGIGTIMIRSLSEDRIVSLRGVSDPEVIKTRIEALRPKVNTVLIQ
jgi:membrane protein YdbS with pleckstrin-like domain